MVDLDRKVPFAVPHGQEHPSWSRYAYLCGACGEVSYADDWLAFKYDEERWVLVYVVTDGEDVAYECEHKGCECDGFITETTSTQAKYGAHDA